MKLIFTNRLFLCLGFGSFTFLRGGLSVWGVDYLEEYYDMNGSSVSIIWGGTSLVAGTLAHILGSMIQDRRLKPWEDMFNTGEITENWIETKRCETSC